MISGEYLLGGEYGRSRAGIRGVGGSGGGDVRVVGLGCRRDLVLDGSLRQCKASRSGSAPKTGIRDLRITGSRQRGMAIMENARLDKM